MKANPRVFGRPPAGTTCRKREAAYAIIRRADGRVAVVEANGRWFLPGGGSHAGETPERTVAREIEEECGRRARVLDKLGEALQYFHSATDGCWYEMFAVFFRAELEEMVGTGEHELRWVDPVPAASRFFHPCHAWAVSL